MSTVDVAASGQRASSLKVASGLLGLATIVTRLTTLVVMALLARGAGTESVGYYGLATLGASFTAAALSLGFPTYLTRNVPAGLVPSPEVARIHCGRLVVLLAAAAVAYPVAGVTLAGEFRLGFFLFFLASLLEQWNETAWVLVRGTRSAWVEPLTNATTSLLLVAVCAADAWLSDGLTFGEAAIYLAVAAIVRSGAAIGMAGVWRHLRVSRQANVARHVRQALPYFASDLLGLMYFRGDVIVLALFVSASRVGEYVSAAAIIGPAVQVAASMGVGALAYAAPRLLTGHQAADDPTAIFRFFRTSGLAAAGLIHLGLPVAVAILFGGEGHTILVLAMILALFLALRFANFGLSAILLAGGHASSRLLVLVLSIVGNVGLNIALDGSFGAYGAAWATVLTELIVAGSLLWFIHERALVRPAVVSVGFVAVAATVMVVLLEVLEPAPAALATGVLFGVGAAVSLIVQGRPARQAQTLTVEAT
jgi:O-antigen/teichoic acid export membrane protein